MINTVLCVAKIHYILCIHFNTKPIHCWNKTGKPSETGTPVYTGIPVFTGIPAITGKPSELLITHDLRGQIEAIWLPSIHM